MDARDIIEYHSRRAQSELDLGFTSEVMAASRAHLQLAKLHMQRLREITGEAGRSKPLLTM
jgi:hypothetical protein